MAAKYPEAVAALEIPEATPDDRPSLGHSVRVIATPLVLLALGVLSILFWNLVVGIILCVIAVATALIQTAIAMLFKKYVLAPHANIFKLVAKIKEPGAIHRSGSAAVDADDPESTVDAAVGFSLTRAAAEGGFFSGNMDAEQKAAFKANVLSERELTYEWLQAMPKWNVEHVEAEDGVVLEARVCPCAPESGKWVILCHGYAGTWDSMLQYARHWSEAGFNLLIPTMRAHGASGGKLIGMGYLDRRDVVVWAKRLVSGMKGGVAATDIVLMGHSMGASSVNLANAQPDLPSEVKAVVSDCGFDNLWHVECLVLDSLGVPIHPTLDLVRMLLCVTPGGYDFAKGDIVETLPVSQAPTLFIHGAQDAAVPAYMLKKLALAARPECEALLVDGAGHCQASLADPTMYWNGVLNFVAQFVR